MFCTVHLMTVMTSREPHLKCVKKYCPKYILFLRVSTSRQSSLTHTACRCMVVLSGTSLTDSLLPWRLPSIIFSGEFGGSQETVTLGFCIKLHILTVFSTDLYGLSDHFSRPVSQTPICFKSPLLYSTC